MSTIGVCLAGCGFLDGAEIFESVATLYHIENSGANYLAMAPDVDQAHVVNHLTGEVMAGEQRNVLIEAARIVRGNITDVVEVNPDDLDALILPGGFGAAKNLSTYAFDGAECTVNEDVAKLVRAMIDAGKPVGAICIAPATLAKILEGGAISPKLTIGNDAATARDIDAMGSRHINCVVTDFVTDTENRIVTTPAYMLAEKIGDAWTGIGGLVEEILEMVATPKVKA